MMIRTWLSRAVRRLRGKTPALGRRGSVPSVGPGVECNICEWRGAAFEGGAHSESAVCPSCNSISRDRFVHYSFTRRMPPRKGMRILDTSPRLGKSYRDAMKE